MVTSRPTQRPSSSRRRRVFATEERDEPVGGHEVACLQQEDGQYGPLLGVTELERLVVGAHAESAEELKVHVRGRLRGLARVPGRSQVAAKPAG
jgi:hypothetical protein